MTYSLPELISYLIIVCCGIALGYIIGHARGRQEERKLIVVDNFPLLTSPEIAN